MKYFFCLILLFYTGHVSAQDSAPEALQTLPTISANIPIIAQENPALQNMLDLQYQVQLLKRLVTREQTVNQMATAAKAIGLEQPILPAPTRNLCQAVPANIPCAQIYPDLYAGFDVMPVTTVETRLPTPKPSSYIAKSNKTTQKSYSPALYWLDITCLQNKCSALLASDPQDTQSYVRLREGQHVNESTITRISVAGVTVSYKGQKYQIPPAPRG